MSQLLPAGIQDGRHLSRRREANLGRRKEGRPISQKESSALGKTHPSHIKHEPDKTTNPQSPINCLLKRKAMRLWPTALTPPQPRPPDPSHPQHHMDFKDDRISQLTAQQSIVAVLRSEY